MRSLNSVTPVFLAVALLLVGCSTPAAPLIATSSPPVELESTVPALQTLADLGDTRWLVDDSQGDRTTVRFNVDGSVSYTTSGQSFEYPEDTWTVDGDSINWQVTYGARYGVWTLVGVFDSETQLITGTWTSTVNESGTFEAKQPVR